MVRKAWHMLLVIALLAAVVLAAPGCDSSQQEEAPQEPDSEPPFKIEVSFPHGAPALNQTAELVITAFTRLSALHNMRVELTLPDAFELVSGSLSWSGDIPGDVEIQVASAVVKSVKVGNWTIEVHRYVDPDEHSGFGIDGGLPIYVSVTEDSAEWGIIPPWYGDPTKPVEMIQEDDAEIMNTSESRPIEIDLELSRAPKLGETADLTLTIVPNSLPDRGSTQYRAWIEVSHANTTGSYEESKLKIETPSSNILASGESASWDLSLTEEGRPVELRSTVRFPEEGYWEITVFLQRDDRERPMWGDDIRVAVYQDRAGIYGSAAYQAGELEWMKDYSPSLAGRDNYPIQGTMDLSGPPRLGEPVELTWSVTVTQDIENFSVKTKLYHYKRGSWENTEFTGETMLVEGDLTWQGALKKGVPLSSSATLVIPEEGDWKVTVIFSDAGRTLSRLGMQESVFLNVTEERGRWGWVESHRRVEEGASPEEEEGTLPEEVEEE